MSAPAKLRALMKRLFGRSSAQVSSPAQIDTAQASHPDTDPTPLFSLGDSKQELVASYRNLESKSA